MTTKKILFILKKRIIYGDDTYTTLNSGLFNSATFVNKMLNDNNVESNLVDVIDNNQIDKFVTQYRPDVVIIEALWVTPSKFDELIKRHPKVKWVIRIHSEIPFIANEGIALEWILKYIKYDNVIVSANSKDFIESIEPLINKKLLYLPNYYPINESIEYVTVKTNYDEINIGLFGAIRPMKNALTQAIGAIIYANENNKILNLHINTERVEQKGENTLKNIRALFENSKHNLVEHKWLKHDEFLKLISSMDIGLQVSLTETYNIVAADFISQNIPILSSKEIVFVNFLSRINKNKNAKLIADKIKSTLNLKQPLTFLNRILLKINASASRRVWLEFAKNN